MMIPLTFTVVVLLVDLGVIPIVMMPIRQQRSYSLSSSSGVNS
jgi:hypothetical protein